MVSNDIQLNEIERLLINNVDLKVWSNMDITTCKGRELIWEEEDNIYNYRYLFDMVRNEPDELIEYFINYVKRYIAKSIQIFIFNIRYQQLSKLLKEVYAHNSVILSIIKKLKVIDGLTAIGHRLDFEDRLTLYEVLKINRDQLEFAIKTEKIFREHPDVTYEKINLDSLTSFEARSYIFRAKNFQTQFNEAITIGLRVQNLIDSLHIDI